MTSLAALAHTTPAAPPFNANFHIVAATIIPVLFLAIVVQGGSYEGLMKVLVALGRAVDRDEWYKSGPAAAYPLVLVVGGLILVPRH